MLFWLLVLKPPPKPPKPKAIIMTAIKIKPPQFSFLQAQQISSHYDGTVSLQISSANVPSIIIYKLSYINFMIFKLLVNVKFANIINIINGREVIPELLQKECNAREIFNTVIYFLKNPNLIEKQLSDCNKTLEGIKSKTSSSNESASILSKYLAF